MIRNNENLYEILDGFLWENRYEITEKGFVQSAGVKTTVFIADDGEIASFDHTGNTHVDGVEIFTAEYSENLNVHPCPECDFCDHKYDAADYTPEEQEIADKFRTECVVDYMVQDFSEHTHEWIVSMIENYENKLYEIFDEEFQ